MHAMWKGSVSFGLVNVPIRLFAATESKDIKLRYLHKACQTPIQYTRTCPTCDKALEWSEIVRGFEYEPNRFVILDEEDLAQVQKSRSQTIDIVDFVELREIDPVFYDKTYYLAPEASGKKAYALLRNAMEQSGRIAIAKTVLRNAETLACVRATGDVLVMETLFWPDEVRSTEELPNLRDNMEVSATELEMATTLISQLQTSFTPEKYVDTRREALMEMIERKRAQEELTVSPTVQSGRENILDLMQALQESIQMTKPAVKRSRKKTS